MAETGVIAVLYENFADQGTLSGGNWVNTASIKLSNLLTPYLPEVARSISTAPTDTQFVANLGGPRIVGGVALGPATIRADTQWRVRAFNDIGLTEPLYDSGTMDAPGTLVESGDLEWEDEGFWEGITSEFADLYKGVYLIHLPPNDISAQFWKFEVFDDGNPADYIDFGRLFIGRRWSPSHNFSVGARLDFEDMTDEEEARPGTKFYFDRNIRRVFNFALEYQPDSPTAQDIFRIAMRARRSRQIVVVPFPDDLSTYQREAFIGNMRKLPAILRPVDQFVNTDFIVEEAL